MCRRNAGLVGCFVFTWSFFRLPEVKGRTYEELDILFNNGVPARRSASTKVDAYADHREALHNDKS